MQKTIFPIFPKNWVRDLSGVPENTSPILMHLPCIYYFLSIFTNCPRETFWPILTKMVFRKFRKKWKMLHIEVFKQNLQKLVFFHFSEKRVQALSGSPRILHSGCLVCPLPVTFCSFLPIVPGGHFDQFCTKWIFENFEKSAKC